MTPGNSGTDANQRPSSSLSSSILSDLISAMVRLQLYAVLAASAGRGRQKLHDQWMRPGFRQRHLWLNERADEEAVTRQFKLACLAVFTACGEAQRGIFKVLVLLRIDFVVA